METTPEKKRSDGTMSEGQAEVTRLTSVQLLDVAIWREIGTQEPQPASAFLEALSTLLGRWLVVRSTAPEIDAVTVLCKARGYISRHRDANSEVTRNALE
jgi:adenylate cyclase